MVEIAFEILKFIYRRLYDLYYITFKRERLRRLLLKYNRYYAKLGKNKRSFEREVWDFIRNNNFIPREDVKMTMTLKTIIASHAIQLSFKLTDEAYDYYDKIIVYKDYYLSRITQRHHKAEVNPGLRIIVFSVRAIHESLQRPDDGINVLLHEFAHALWLEQKLMGNQYEVFEEYIFNEVMETMKEEFTRLAASEEHFFRKYAFANEAEFFAVAVENFFERSAEFKQQLPDLYRLLVALMKQDPLALH